jgi:hypothetical protein
MSTWNPDETANEPEQTPSRMAGLKALASQFVGRAQLANLSGFSFRGARDMFRALGYDRLLTPRMYRWRYERGGIVARLVESKPIATWRGGGELVEDEDPDTETTFEAAWIALNKRLDIWPTLERLDILAGLGKYSVLLIGAPGQLDTPLTNLTADNLAYLQPFSERDAKIINIETDSASRRFGLPVFYTMSRLTAPLEGISASMARRVHYTRIIHVADGLLDDRVYGQARLERVWNLLDDLDKVCGGGAEAFWKRVDAGMQLKLDPNIADMKPEDKVKFDEQLEEYTNGLRRILKTRGVEIETMTSAVAGIKDPVMTLISLISAATSIPQRILLGSERGELASSQDRDEWSERIQDRRVSYAGPQVVRPLVNRLIELGAMPEPVSGEYDVRWPAMKTMDEIQKVAVAKEVALMNQAQGEIVVTSDEIRDRYLDLPPIEEVLTPEELAARNAPPPPPVVVPGQVAPPAPPVVKVPTAARRRAKWAVLSIAAKRTYLDRVAAKRKEQQWKPIQAAADRFSRRRKAVNE